MLKRKLFALNTTTGRLTIDRHRNNVITANERRASAARATDVFRDKDDETGFLRSRRNNRPATRTVIITILITNNKCSGGDAARTHAKRNEFVTCAAAPRPSQPRLWDVIVLRGRVSKRDLTSFFAAVRRRRTISYYCRRRANSLFK